VELRGRWQIDDSSWLVDPDVERYEVRWSATSIDYLRAPDVLPLRQALLEAGDFDPLGTGLDAKVRPF
jgi:hypothetical protein